MAAYVTQGAAAPLQTDKNLHVVGPLSLSLLPARGRARVCARITASNGNNNSTFRSATSWIKSPPCRKVLHVGCLGSVQQ